MNFFRTSELQKRIHHIYEFRFDKKDNWGKEVGKK